MVVIMGILNDIIRKELEKMLQEELKNELPNVDETDKKEPENVDETDKKEPKSVGEKPKSEPEEPPASVDDKDKSQLLVQIEDLKKQVEDLQKINRLLGNLPAEENQDSTIDDWFKSLGR